MRAERITAEKPLRNNGGFSLVEILVAVAILVLCAIPLMNAFVQSLNANVRARQDLSATTLAENIMEEIKAAGAEGYGTADGTTVTIEGEDFPVYRARYQNYSFDGRYWQVEAVMTPSDATYLEGSGERYFNTSDITELSGMDSQTDAVYVQPADERRELAEDYAASHMGLQASVLEENMITRYHFEIGSSHGLDTLVQTVTYEDGSGNVLSQESQTIFDTIQNGGRLEKLYVFYVPASRTASAAAHEIITVENPKSLPVSVYLVRQGGGGLPLELSVEEGTIGSPASTGIYTNLDTSLGSADFGRIYRNGTLQTLTSAKSLFGLYGLDHSGDASARLYEVEVTVTPVDGTDSVTLTGTALP